MDSEEPPNVRVACSGDIDEVVRLMHDAAAWMSAKGTPAWDVARIDRTFAETFVLRSELLVASCSDGIVGCCTLSRTHHLQKSCSSCPLSWRPSLRR
ncbi:hypothetical protein RBI07_25540 [Pseudomonas aeruginosa]|nr:hypothetical protein [Pseudomonas aeruginosa]WMI74403.1 hypothetical protein RBI07_25540 [Pseudomonas aeruginosa]